MADDRTTIELSRSELRQVAGYAVACARPALAIFERDARSRILANPVVVDVLRRYPVAPRGGGRVGELIRPLDPSLR